MAALLAAMALVAGYTSTATIYHAYPSPTQIASSNTFCDCIQSIAKPGDECRLHAGRYFVGPERCVVQAGKLRGTIDRPVIISAAGDGPVIIDGTVPIEGPWKLTANGHYESSVPNGSDILQLFDSEQQMRVLARYPNAGWKDKSMFMAVSNWFRSKVPGTHDLATKEGLLRDNGACSTPEACCAKCNTHDLAKSGINATGALAIMNLWSCDTGVQRVKEHNIAQANILRYDATWVGLCDTYRGGDGRYYLEGLESFLDTDEEWLFNNDTKRVVLASKPDQQLRGRVSDYALVVDDAAFLIVSNMSFHATTFSISGNVSDITLSSLVLNYSAISRRSLGDNSPPIALSVWRDNRIQTVSGIPGNFLLQDLEVRYSDGPALMLNGDHSTIRDCLFEWNDWSTVGGTWPPGVVRRGKANRATTCRTSGVALVFERLTFRNNGAAQGDAGRGGGARGSVSRL